MYKMSQNLQKQTCLFYETRPYTIFNTHYFTTKLIFLLNFILILLNSFILNSLYTIFTQSKFTTIILTKTTWETYTNSINLVP